MLDGSWRMDGEKYDFIDHICHYSFIFSNTGNLLRSKSPRWYIRSKIQVALTPAGSHGGVVQLVVSHCVGTRTSTTRLCLIFKHITFLSIINRFLIIRILTYLLLLCTLNTAHTFCNLTRACVQFWHQNVKRTSFASKTKKPHGSYCIICVNRLRNNRLYRIL